MTVRTPMESLLQPARQDAVARLACLIEAVPAHIRADVFWTAIRVTDQPELQSEWFTGTYRAAVADSIGISQLQQVQPVLSQNRQDIRAAASHLNGAQDLAQVTFIVCCLLAALLRLLSESEQSTRKAEFCSLRAGR